MPDSAAVPLLEVRDLYFAYPQSPALLQGIHFCVPQGQTLGFMGRSGSGKTTLLSVLMGLLQESQGEILLSGTPLSALERRGKGGYVPQRPALMPWRSVLDNLLLPTEVLGLSRAEATQEALSLLERFELAHTAKWWPHQLSGGMAQRMAVLRGVLFGSRLLYLDEPFSALDALTRLEFQGWLRDLRKELGLTIVLVTHDVREATALCDEVLVLRGGHAQLFSQGDDLEQRLLSCLLDGGELNGEKLA